MLLPTAVETTDFVALVFKRRTERVASTALFPIGADSSVRLVLDGQAESGDEVHLVAYPAARLEGVLPEDRSLIEQTPLQIAAEGEKHLPPATVHAQGVLEGERLELTSAGVLPFRLTASWLPDCARSSEEFMSGLSCTVRSCAPKFARSGCHFELDVSDCLLAPTIIEGERDVLGQPSLTANGGAFERCRTREGSPATGLSLLCIESDASACSVEVRPRSEPEFELEVERVVVQPDTNLPGPSKLDTEYGAIRGLVVRDDRVYVHHRSTQLISCSEVSGEPSDDRLSVIEPDTMSVLAEFDVPLCVTSLALDPAGPGVLVLGVDELGPALARIDEAGRVVTVAHWSVDLTRLPIRPVSVASHSDPSWIAVLLGETSSNPDSFLRRGALLRLDLETLGVTATLTELVPTPESLIALSDGRAGFVDDYGDELFKVNISNMNVDQRTGIRVIDAIQPRRVASLYEHSSSGRFFIAHAGEADAGLLPIVADSGLVELTRLTPEHRGQPSEVGPWPSQVDRALVGYLLDEPGDEAYLSVYDTRETRFLLGAVPVGRGQLRYLRADADGRVWLALPWTGEVLRVTPR